MTTIRTPRLRRAGSRPALNPIAIAAVLALSAPLAANAVTTYSWRGGGDDNALSTNNNWQGDAAPPVAGLTTSDLIFHSSDFANPNIKGAVSIHSLFFIGDSAYTFDGGKLTLGAGGLTNYAGNAQSFNTTQFALGADQTWLLYSTGTLSFNAGLNTSGGPGNVGRALTIEAATSPRGNNVINGAIGGGGSLTKTGAGTLILTGASNYTGPTTVNAGKLAIGNGASIMGGNLQVNAGATLEISGDHARVIPGPFATVTVDGTTASPGRVDLTGSASTLSTGQTVVGATGAGILNQSGGNFTTNGGTLYLGLGNESSGTYNLSGGNLSTGGSYAIVGNVGSGTFNQSGGSFTISGAALILGNLAGSSGTYNLSGGSLTTGRTQVSDDDSTGVFTQSGGTHTTTTLSLTGYDAASKGAYNLNGGTLVAGTVTSGDAGVSGTSTFNFNGGVLQASAANPSFLQGLTTANVQAGGAKVDTAGFNVTIAQNLLHDTTAGAVSLDGGLTKLGAGTLTLSGTNTFAGGLNIVAGTVAVGTEQNLGGGKTVNVTGSGTLRFDSSATLGRTYNLGVATLASGTGNTLTFGMGAKVNGGALASGAYTVGNGSVLNGTRVAGGAALSQGSGTASFNNVLLTGTSSYTQATGAALLATGDFTANPQTTLVVNGAVDLHQGGSISGGLTINNGGAVTTNGGAASPLYLDGSRGTTINAGGHLAAEGGTTIELGGLLVNNGSQRGVLDVNLGGFAKGSGTFGTVNIADGGKFSPGNSPGTATAESVTFASSGRYDFELNTATPRFGRDSDLLITDLLSITASTTPGSLFTIAVDSLNLSNQSAALTDFDGHLAYHWLLVDADSVSGFDSAKFYIDSSGFSNSLDGGNFSVSLNGNDVYLDFNPMAAAVPEPSSWALMLAGAAMVGGLQARRRRLA